MRKCLSLSQPRRNSCDLAGLLLASDNPRQAAKLHAHLITTNSISHPYLHSLLVSLYARCNLLPHATAVLISPPSIDADSNENQPVSAAACTSILSRLSRSDRPADAVSFFATLRCCGLLPYPNAFTFSSILPACQSSCGSQIHSLVVKNGSDSHLFVSSALADMYAKSFDMASAKLVFDEMPNRNLVCWNALIVGYLHNVLYKEAILAFRELLMIGPSIRPDQVSFSSVLSSCANSCELNLGQGTHSLAVKSGLEPLAYVKNSLIDMYTKCGCFNTAHELFDEMLDKDVVTWNIMAAGFVQSERFEEAIGLFLAMRRHHPQPDEASFSTVLNAAANLAELLLGTEIHCQVLKFGFPPNRSITSLLITMYSKCGCLEYAELVFSEVKKFHNVVPWTAMIAALQLHGHGDEVLQLFDEMLESGITPDYITFVCVLSACSHTGLVERGFKYFYSMSREHSLIPTSEHYACIVDMLGRAGRLDEAKQFIDEMPLQPDVSVWGSLLGACRNCQNLELGREVAYKLFQIEPLNPGNYILLSNLYASHGRMEEADEVRALMRISGVKKVTSYSWIEVRRKTFVFTAHDLSHERTREIYEMLRKMEELVKEKGYVADTRFAVNHVEGYKEHGLWCHSERLALAFGLISFQEGGVIRVKKNLRTCGDCHTVMKLLSGILRREIVLRDTNRFHRFADGSCSCGDYW